MPVVLGKATRYMKMEKAARQDYVDSHRAYVDACEADETDEVQRATWLTLQAAVKRYDEVRAWSMARRAAYNTGAPEEWLDSFGL